ncbi:MAG: Asp-tRNA(Asn)/Glu-tRNA(Gln) amidotransferase subunit GatC [Bacteroidia bacterium]|jgi:aspartyl-tRNA(Asn)/glutamyl-tRNA(Gln) amidotransferase subunit C
MNIDKATVERVANLARLSFTEEEKEKVQAEMTKIVSFIEKMNELDTEGVEPLIFMSDEINAFREDNAYTEITKEEALKNAPQKDSDYFKVPKVIERE